MDAVKKNNIKISEIKKNCKNKTEKKYYAVAKGKRRGIYATWEETKEQVNGFSGAKYKSFKTIVECQDYIDQENNIPKENTDQNIDQNVNLSPNLMALRNIKGVEPYILVDDVIVMYTDGSCKNKKGGWGLVVINSQRQALEFNGPVPIDECTNQIAELYAIYRALKYGTENFDVNSIKFVIRTDSMYSIGCFTKWINNWLKNDWITAEGTPVENKNIIEYIYNIVKTVNVSFEHVKAHNGNTYNEIADRLAKNGANLKPSP